MWSRVVSWSDLPSKWQQSLSCAVEQREKQKSKKPASRWLNCEVHLIHHWAMCYFGSAGNVISRNSMNCCKSQQMHSYCSATGQQN